LKLVDLNRDLIALDQVLVLASDVVKDFVLHQGLRRRSVFGVKLQALLEHGNKIRVYRRVNFLQRAVFLLGSVVCDKSEKLFHFLGLEEVTGECLIT